LADVWSQIEINDEKVECVTSLSGDITNVHLVEATFTITKRAIVMIALNAEKASGNALDLARSRVAGAVSKEVHRLVIEHLEGLAGDVGFIHNSNVKKPVIILPV